MLLATKGPPSPCSPSHCGSFLHSGHLSVRFLGARQHPRLQERFLVPWSFVLFCGAGRLAVHKDPRSPARAQLYLGARGLCSGSVAWRRRWARGQGHGVDAGRTGQSAHGEGRKDVWSGPARCAGHSAPSPRGWAWGCRASVVLEERQEVIIAIAGQVGRVQVGQELIGVGEFWEEIQRRLRHVGRSLRPRLTL